MITLYTFGPYFGLPDGSPFVMKAMLLLKFAGLEFREDRNGYGRAPKGKLPFIEDDGTRIADSTFIRFHIEQKYNFDFDARLPERDRGVAWAAEKLAEDHLYWAIVHARWADDANFAKGPAQFFAAAPAPIRSLIKRMARAKTRKAGLAQGLGKHTRAEIEQLAVRDLRALSAILGESRYLMGDQPCAADASVSSMVAAALVPIFDTAIRTEAERLGNLVAYSARIRERYFPGLA